MESILTSIKKLIGITESDTAFDTDLIIHINTAFMSLTDLKVGPSAGFIIEDDTATWTDFIKDPKKLAASKSYVYLRVKLLFDSESLSSAHIAAIERQIDKLEWLLNVGAESEGTSIDDATVSEEIKALIAELESENESLKVLAAELEASVKTLTTEKSELESENGSLKTTVDNLEADNTDLQAAKETLETQNAELTESNEALQGENAGLEARLEEAISSIKPEQEKAVTITENGTTDVLPDDGKTLSRVSVSVDVASVDNSEAIIAQLEAMIDESGVLV